MVPEAFVRCIKVALVGGLNELTVIPVDDLYSVHSPRMGENTKYSTLMRAPWGIENLASEEGRPLLRYYQLS